MHVNVVQKGRFVQPLLKSLVCLFVRVAQAERTKAWCDEGIPECQNPTPWMQVT